VTLLRPFRRRSQRSAAEFVVSLKCERAAQINVSPPWGRAADQTLLDADDGASCCTEQLEARLVRKMFYAPGERIVASLEGPAETIR